MLNLKQFATSLQRRLPSIPPPTARNLWITLAALVAIQNIAVFHTSQPSTTTIFAVLIWGGAIICMEDKFEHLKPVPSRWSLILGTIMLIWVMLRTSIILHWDGILLLLAPLAGLSLALLCFPLRNIFEFRDPLLTLMLLPSFALLMRVLPEEPISLVTARISGLWLSTLGLEVLVKGRNVYLQGGGVEVLGACNGVDMMAQIFCVGVIFLLAFPVKSNVSRFLILVAAPLLGLACNTFRIALLAYIVAAGYGKGTDLFDFFHQDGGSLVFSGIAMFAFGFLYLRLLEMELVSSNLPPAK